MSFGSHCKMLQSFSNVIKVMFLFFLRESNVLLSMPRFKSWYCEMFLSSIVFHNGAKSIIVLTPVLFINSIIGVIVQNKYCGDNHNILK